MATIETAYYVPTFLGLSTTLGISCGISIVCIAAFEICKRIDSMKCLFSPRTQLTVNPISSQPKHLFAWITSTFNMDERECIEKIGLDATMHIRYLRMVVHFLTFHSLLVCPVLLVLHWTGAANTIDGSDLATEFTTFAKNESSHPGFPSLNDSSLPDATGEDHFRSNSTLYYLSIANIPNKSSLVWVHVFFVFTISLSWLWLLFVNHIHHIDLMQLQQQKRSSLLHERSVLITHVPHLLRNKAALQQHFERAHVGLVECVTLVSNTATQLVNAILKKRLKTIHQLESSLIQFARQEKRIVWHEWLIRFQKRQVGSESAYERISQLLQAIQTMDKDIVKLRDQTRAPEYYMPTGSAFVTFKSAHSAQMCAQIVTSWKPGVMAVRMAPEPRDMLWRSLLRRGRKSHMMGVIRKCVVFAAVWSLTIFWLFPITFVLGLTSIQSLSQHFSFLRYFLASSMVVRSFVQNILPTLLVTLFMSLLPWIVFEISKQQDFVSYSELEDAILGRYYHFAIFNVLIVFLLGTTFLTTILDVLYEPTMLIQLLANSLPQGANFFLNYVLFNLSTHAMELIQLGSQLFGHFLVTQPFLSRTPRMKMQYTSPWPFPFYYYYPNHILLLVITLTYSVIQPLILIFALFYFGFALIVYRHQHMYCYVRRYETHGSRHYRRVVRYTSDGLLIFQFTMVGLLYLKGVLAAATSLVPLVVFTVWCKMKLNRLFQKRTKHPYVGRFYYQSVTSHHLRVCEESLEPESSYLWEQIDDIWRLSYLKAWWSSGRYAQHSSSNLSTVHIATLEQQIRESISSFYHGTDSCSTMFGKSTYQTMAANLPGHDLTTYSDDSKSVHETYEHPALVTPLISELILPLNPNETYWNIKECVQIPLKTLMTLFHHDYEEKE